MTLPSHAQDAHVPPDSGLDPRPSARLVSDPRARWETAPIRMLDEDEPERALDPGAVILTCANCGAAMDERKCKLICRCGYFLSCSDYY